MSATTTIELAPRPGADISEVDKNHDSPAEQTIEQDLSPTVVEKKGKTASIITVIAGVTTISSLLSGIVTIALPVMAKDLDISPELLFWPTSVYSLSCGCTLILSGAIADVAGPRTMYLIGTFFQSVFTLACGLAHTSIQMIVFRALAGVAISFCLPSAVSLISSYFPPGRRRNLAFGTMGGGQPLGFTIGLVMGGGLTDSAGWQIGFYLAAGINSLLFIFALVVLPNIPSQRPVTWARLKTEIDWVGACILSTSLAMLLYVFATWTGEITNIKSAESISLLTIGLALLPTFVLWVHRQESLGKTVLIRNSIWRNKAFTSICLNVFLIYGSFNATETFITFLFQDVQGLSATSTSVRFLPEPASGAVLNVLMGLYVHRLRANWALALSFVASAMSPLLLAVMREGSSYWAFEFPAIALIAWGPDVLYTISQLLITAEFDESTQALAGGVFNTVAQIGKSVGIAMSAVVASSVNERISKAKEEDGMLEGYRAAWWFCFALTTTCILITIFGLRNIGKVGVKRE